jgi:uncharacterized protein (DUF433 family)
MAPAVIGHVAEGCARILDMNLQEIPLLLRDHFEQTPNVLGGKLRLRGTRVSVEQVLELLEAGVSPAEIIQSFPSLSEQDVIAVERLAAHCALTMLQPA